MTSWPRIAASGTYIREVVNHSKRSWQDPTITDTSLTAPPRTWCKGHASGEGERTLNGLSTPGKQSLSMCSFSKSVSNHDALTCADAHRLM